MIAVVGTRYWEELVARQLDDAWCDRVASEAVAWPSRGSFCQYAAVPDRDVRPASERIISVGNSAALGDDAQADAVGEARPYSKGQKNDFRDVR